MADLWQIFLQKKGIRGANYHHWKTDNFSNCYTFSNKGKYLLSTLDKTQKVTFFIKGRYFFTFSRIFRRLAGNLRQELATLTVKQEIVSLPYTSFSSQLTSEFERVAGCSEKEKFR